MATPTLLDINTNITAVKTEVVTIGQVVGPKGTTLIDIKSVIDDVKTDTTAIKDIKTNTDTIKTEVSETKGNTGTIKTDVSTIKSDVGETKGNTSTIKSDVSNVKTTVGTIESAVGTTKDNTTTIKSSVGDIKTTTDTISTGVQSIGEVVGPKGTTLVAIKSAADAIKTDTKDISTGVDALVQAVGSKGTSLVDIKSGIDAARTTLGSQATSLATIENTTTAVNQAVLNTAASIQSGNTALHTDITALQGSIAGLEGMLKPVQTSSDPLTNLNASLVNLSAALGTLDTSLKNQLKSLPVDPGYLTMLQQIDTSVLTQASNSSAMVQAVNNIKNLPLDAASLASLQQVLNAISTQRDQLNTVKTAIDNVKSLPLDAASATTLQNISGAVSNQGTQLSAVANAVGSFRNLPLDPASATTLQSINGAVSGQTSQLSAVATAVDNIKHLPLDPVSATTLQSINGAVSSQTTQLGSMATAIGNIKNLPLDAGSLATLSTISATVVAQTAQLQTVANAIDDVKATLKATAFPLLDTIDEFEKQCAIVQPALTGVGKDDLTSSKAPTDGLPSFPIGQPLSLAALVPKAGSAIPTGTGSSAVLKAIPDAALVHVQWIIEVWDTGHKQWISARAATDVADTEGHYQILDGALSSLSLNVLPWPSIDGDRHFRFTLNVKPWWPGAKLPGTPTADDLKKFVTGQGFKQVPQGLLCKMSKLSADSIPGLKDLFQLKVDNIAPAPGKPCLLSILPVDKSLMAAQKIDSIVHANPDIHLQAALDVGAPIQNLISALTKAVTSAVSSLFGSSSEPSPIPAAVPEGILDVSKVLTGLMNIPIALDYNGKSVATTLKPKDGYLSPLISQLPNTSNLGGLLPIGQLLTLVSATSDKIKAEPDSTDKKVKQTQLSNICGLSLLPVPEFGSISVRPDKDVLSSIKYKVSLDLSINVPGASTSLTKNISLGDLTLKIPKVPLPSIAFFLKHYIDDRDHAKGDLLIAADPLTSQFLPSIDVLTQEIRALLSLSNSITRLFPDNASWRSFNNIMGYVIGLLGVPNVTIMSNGMVDSTGTMKSCRRMFADPQWFHKDDKGNYDPGNISVAILLGAPDVCRYRLYMLCDRTANLPQMISFGTRNITSGRAAMILGGPVNDDQVWAYESDTPTQYKDHGRTNDRYMGLEWYDETFEGKPDWLQSVAPPGPEKGFSILSVKLENNNKAFLGAVQQGNPSKAWFSNEMTKGDEIQIELEGKSNISSGNHYVFQSFFWGSGGGPVPTPQGKGPVTSPFLYDKDSNAALGLTLTDNGLVVRGLIF